MSAGNEISPVPSFMITVIHFSVRVTMREDPAKVKEILWVGSSRISFSLSWSNIESQARPIFVRYVSF